MHYRRWGRQKEMGHEGPISDVSTDLFAYGVIVRLKVLLTPFLEAVTVRT